MPEKHHHNEYQTIHRKRARKVRTLKAQRMPFQVINRTEERHNHDNREKPLRVKQTLHMVPQTAHNRAEKEEVGIRHHLNKAGVLKERVFMVIKPRGHINRGIHHRRTRP